MYDVLHSEMKKPRREAVETEEQGKTAPASVQVKYLFTTSTCPNCKVAKQILEGETYELIDAEKNPEMARKYGIMQAPTLVVLEDGQTKKYVNASNIQKFVDDEA